MKRVRKREHPSSVAVLLRRVEAPRTPNAAAWWPSTWDFAKRLECVRLAGAFHRSWSQCMRKSETRLSMNRPTHDPSQEGNRHRSASCPFPSWEGLGVGSWSRCMRIIERRLTMNTVCHLCSSQQMPISLSADDARLIDRREFLWRFGGGLGGIALAHLLGHHGLLADTSAGARADLNGGLHHRARARRVVQLFMSGAASQCDTFDHQPALVKRSGEKFDPG